MAALEAISQLTAQGGTTTVKALAGLLQVWPRAAEALLFRLKERGMIYREDGNNRVGGTTRLTERGRSALEAKR